MENGGSAKVAAINGGAVKEKALALERADEAHDKATGLQSLWQSCKNDLVAARLDAAASQRQLVAERTKLRQAKDQVAELMSKVTGQEKRIKNLEYDLKQSESKVRELKEAVASKDIQINFINQKLTSAKGSSGEQKIEIENSRKVLEEKDATCRELEAQLASTEAQLRVAQEKLDSWPHIFISKAVSITSYFNIFAKITNVSNDFSNYSMALIKSVLGKFFV